MKYLDSLIAWGDYLFRQDGMESISEATQLYILAAEILGPRPREIRLQAKPPVESFNELESEFDAFSNALVEVENLVPPLPGTASDRRRIGHAADAVLLHSAERHDARLHGIPSRPALQDMPPYEHRRRGASTTLFEPPIDPGALVKAVAGGVDIGSALADLNAPYHCIASTCCCKKPTRCAAT